MSKFADIQKEIRGLGNPEKAKLLMRFFKTGKGEYAEGDVFLGIMVPTLRVVAKKYFELSIVDVEKLLHSKYHEERLLALFILTHQFQHGDEKIRKDIFSLYLTNTKYINNWDLIDLSAPKIVGDFLFQKGKGIAVLKKLAKSNHLWDRRIAVLATFQYIKYNSFKESVEIAEMLFHDEHDLIHKSVGWMLREIGKRDLKTEEEFLKKHVKEMQRTMLRYSIEKFSEKKKKQYMCKK